MQFAHNAATGAALTQVRAKLDELLSCRLAIDERRQKRRPAFALFARLNPRVPRQEGATPFVKTAVDLRSGPPCLLLNLVVRVALGAQPGSSSLTSS